MTCLGLQTVKTILISPVSEVLKIDSPNALGSTPPSILSTPQRYGLHRVNK